jgi:hypothetical protein
MNPINAFDNKEESRSNTPVHVQEILDHQHQDITFWLTTSMARPATKTAVQVCICSQIWRAPGAPSPRCESEEQYQMWTWFQKWKEGF